MNLFPHAFLLPLRKVVVANPPRRKVLGHHPPGNAASHHVEDRVEHAALFVAGRTAEPARAGYQRFDDAPFVVRNVAWIALFFHRPPIMGSILEKALTKCRKRQLFSISTIYWTLS
jgi:hypothetical protein